MDPKDTLLSRDVGLRDCICRVLRDYGTHKKLVFVLVESFDIIPNIEQISNHLVLDILSDLTECVYRDGGQIKARRDVFEPVHLEEGQILGNYPLINYHSLDILKTYSRRVVCVMLNGTRCFLKLAPRAEAIQFLANEIRVYHTLMEKGSSLAPKLLAYACDGAPDRIVGFFCEEIIDKYPDEFDSQICEEALMELHDLEILHGDITRYNIIVTANGDGVKFLDFEKARIGTEPLDMKWDDMKIDEQILLFCSLDPISEDDDNLDRPVVTVNKRYLEGLGILLG
ncbi:RIO1 family [Aspergillus sclerotialis]|uniref:non-specific serine/threonine protein kinase n=1 Tax=Aspergillus sclerotialis TaxID=2070753 RepID=A0A3A2ZGK8_9EURO|nr:RIO1 family [Aspergillus sclerotialis]